MKRLLLFIPLLAFSALAMAEATRGMDPPKAWTGRILLAVIIWIMLLPLLGNGSRRHGRGGWARGSPPPDPVDGVDVNISWREIYADARASGHNSPAMEYRERTEPARPAPQLEPEPVLARADAFRDEARDAVAQIAAEVAAWGEHEPR